MAWANVWTNGSSGTGSLALGVYARGSASIAVPNGVLVADESPIIALNSDNGNSVWLDADVTDQDDASGSIEFKLYRVFDDGGSDHAVWTGGTLNSSTPLVSGMPRGRYKVVCTVAYAGAETGLVHVLGG